MATQKPKGKTMKRPNDPTTGNRNVTIAISIPETLVERVKAKAGQELRNVSSMCAVLLTKGLAAMEESNV